MTKAEKKQKLIKETDKAITDALIYGSGFIRIDNDGKVEHISPQNIIIKEKNGS